MNEIQELLDEPLPKDDFELMHEFLKEIEIKLIGIDPIKKMQFLKPLRNVMFEAWKDSCNSKDPFLFGKNDLK